MYLAEVHGMGWILEHKQWSNIAIIYSLLYLAVQFPIFSKCKNEHFIQKHTQSSYKNSNCNHLHVFLKN